MNEWLMKFITAFILLLALFGAAFVFVFCLMLSRTYFGSPFAPLIILALIMSFVGAISFAFSEDEDTDG